MSYYDKISLKWIRKVTLINVFPLNMKYNRLLMSFPKYFDVIHYNLNVHMTMSRNVNKQLSHRQWGDLFNILQSNNIRVDLIPPKKNLVDMVFTANGALIYKNLAIVSKYKALPRQGETECYVDYFKSQNYDVYKMRNYFEGTGDGIFSHSKNHLWLGHGFRSDSNSSNEIKNVLNDDGVKIHSLKLIRPEWYHLDTCFCPIGDGKLLLFDKAFDDESLNEIYSVYDDKDIVNVSENDALNFACNSICIGDDNHSILIGHKFSDELKERVKKLGITKIIENDMSEFLLSGGSVRCSVLDVEVR
jgi:N-dimethylarginine dimethylaminohydrolase